MKVVIDMSLAQLKKYMQEYSDSAYVAPVPEHLAFLGFREYHYQHDPECKEDHDKLRESGCFCPGQMICTPNSSSTIFKILQINP